MDNTHQERHSVPDTIRTPIDSWLESEPLLATPIANFSREHDSPGSQDHFHELIPLSTPGPGEQYAFQIDLDRCFGCKACVAACHSLNGLDETESWREVGYIHEPTSPSGLGYAQTVTSTCHHCKEPGCLQGCPVEAYEKDPVTGIVFHLDDQCIGCSYCILKCPYDVPKFNRRLGIVRKCDLCHGRLSAGEAPACAQACPTHAISVKIETQFSVQQRAEQNHFLPGAPDPSYTQPSTRYVSKREIPREARSGDGLTPTRQPAHWPLIFMLVLTQFSVGFITANALFPTESVSLLSLSLATAVLGVLSSVLHLGKPLRAWRVFLGLRTSWLSREILLFGAYLGILFALSIARWIALPIAEALSIAAVSSGWIAVFTSVMIYTDTHRKAWTLNNNLWRFYGTVLLSMGLGASIAGSSAYLPAVGIIVLLKSLLEQFELRKISPQRERGINRYPVFEDDSCRFWIFLRMFLVAIVLSCALFGLSDERMIVLVWLVIFGGELIERFFFFTTLDVSKMPGEGARHA